MVVARGFSHRTCSPRASAAQRDGGVLGGRRGDVDEVQVLRLGGQQRRVVRIDPDAGQMLGGEATARLAHVGDGD